MASARRAPKKASAPAAKPTARFGARALLAAAALALVAVPGALVLLLVEDKWAPLLRLDNGARDSFHSFALGHAGFVGTMKVFSAAGSAVAWQIILGLVVAWLLWRRLPRLALFVVTTGLGSALLNAVVKTAVHRLRPAFTHAVAHAPGASFPSGHAQSAIMGYSVLLLVFLPILRGAWRRVAIGVAVFMTLAIGFSRIALGVHFLSDVLGGYILGAAWVAAMAAAFNAMRVERGKPAVDVREGLEPEEAPSIAGTGAAKAP